MSRGIKHLPYVGESATPVAEKAPAKNKRVAPRDRYESKPLTAEELDMFRAQRAQEAAAYTANPPKLEVGHSLFVQVVGATIVGIEIHLSVKVAGQVVRPERYADAKAGLISMVVPATITERGE